jgi:hypothetical protein
VQKTLKTGEDVERWGYEVEEESVSLAHLKNGRDYISNQEKRKSKLCPSNGE